MPRFNSRQHDSIWRHLAIPMALLGLPLLLSACGGGGSSGNGNASSSPTFKTLTAQAVEPAGSNCEFGGLADLTGKDTNRNGVLDSNEADPAKTLYTCNQTGALTLGGTVTGLPGDGSQSVTLQNLGMDDQMMSLDGNYLFNTALAEGSTYQAAVASQPNARQCEFADCLHDHEYGCAVKANIDTDSERYYNYLRLLEEVKTLYKQRRDSSTKDEGLTKRAVGKNRRDSVLKLGTEGRARSRRTQKQVIEQISNWSDFDEETLEAMNPDEWRI